MSSVYRVTGHIVPRRYTTQGNIACHMLIFRSKVFKNKKQYIFFQILIKLFVSILE